MRHLNTSKDRKVTQRGGAPSEGTEEQSEEQSSMERRQSRPTGIWPYRYRMLQVEGSLELKLCIFRHALESQATWGKLRNDDWIGDTLENEKYGIIQLHRNFQFIKCVKTGSVY